MKRKTIAVIGNDIDWTVKSGFSFANGLYCKLSEKYFVKVIIPTLDGTNFFSDTDSNDMYINNSMVVKRIYPGKDYWKKVEGNPEIAHQPFVRIMFYADDTVLISGLVDAAGDADVVICNSFFPFSVTRRAFPGRTIIYRSLDLFYNGVAKYHEYMLFNNPDLPDVAKKAMKDVEQQIFNAEKEACRVAHYTLSLTNGDEDEMVRLYGARRDRFIRMPLCLEKAEAYDGFIPDKNYDEVRSCALISSNTPFSEETIKSVLPVSRNFPDITFHFIGSCCYPFEGNELPSNCIMHGIISEQEKLRLLRMSDCALTLPKQNHGMNAKNWDYILYGLVMLSDEFGVRGYSLEKGQDYYYADFDNLHESFREFTSLPGEVRKKIAHSAYLKSICTLRYENFLPAFEKAAGLIMHEADSGDAAAAIDCLIFGAGINGESCYKTYLRTQTYNCLGFIDNRKSVQGSSVLGQKVYSPDEAFHIASGRDMKIIIAVGKLSAVKDLYMQISRFIIPKSIWLFLNGKLLADVKWERVMTDDLFEVI